MKGQNLRRISRKNALGKFVLKGHSKAFGIVSAVLMLAQNSGCVSDKVEQYSVLDSYRQRLVREGPQRRAGVDDMDVLNLLPEPAVPDAEAAEYPAMAQRKVALTIEEAITRTLANSPEIRAVSFNPGISREEITKAAGEFDYTAFGRMNYEQDNSPTNQIRFDFFGNPIDPGLEVSRSKSRLLEAGIKQKSIVGSEWSLAWTLTRGWDNLTSSRLSTRYEPMLVFQLRQPLLRNAWEQLNLAGVNISKLNYRAALAAFRQQTESTAVTVISTYWSLLRTRRELEIQQRLFDLTLDTLKKVEGRREIDATAVQVKQAEASLRAREALLIRAEKRILDVQDFMLRLLADPAMNLLSEPEIIPTTAPDTEAIRFEQMEALQLAIRNSPLIEQARLRVEVAQINLKVAKNQRMPRLDLVASAGVQGFDRSVSDAQEGLINDDFTNYGIGVSFEYPLGNRQRQAELRRRQFERARVVSELQGVLDGVALEVKEKIRKIDTAHEEMQAQAAAVEAATINLQAIEDTEPIRKGLTPEFLLVKLQSQESLANAQREQIKAVVDFNTALAELAEATGTTLRMHQVQAALPSVSDNSQTYQQEGASGRSRFKFPPEE